MSAGEGISGNSSKGRGSQDRRVIRKIFDSAYSPECVENLSDNSRRASFRSSRRGSTRPEAPFERRSCHPGQLPKGAKAIYQTVSLSTPVNKARREGRGCYYTPARMLALLPI